jgi:hypothetical protein
VISTRLKSGAHVVDPDARSGKLGFLADLRLQGGVFTPKPVGFGRPRNQMQEMARLERLFDEIDRALPDRSHCSVQIAVAGNHQNRKRGVPALDLFEQLQSVQLRSLKPDVQKNQRGAPIGERLQGLAAVGGGAGRITLILQDSGYEVPDVFFIVDYEDV